MSAAVVIGALRIKKVFYENNWTWRHKKEH